jgi:hypothetical protein
VTGDPWRIDHFIACGCADLFRCVEQLSRVIPKDFGTRFTELQRRCDIVSREASTAPVQK